MKRRFWNRCVIVLLVAALAAGMLTVPAFAREPQSAYPDFGKAVTAEPEGIALAGDGAAAQIQLYDDEELVTFLVTLDDGGLADFLPKGMDLQGWLQTAAGKQAMAMVQKAQELVAAYFSREKSNITIRRTYSVLMNGFAVTAPYGAMHSLLEIPGVASVAVAQTYSLPREEAEETEETAISWYSGDMMQSREAAEAGYTGEGMVIAVLDTSLDVTHADFANGPENPRLDQQAVAAALAEGSLNALASDTDRVYVSPKIPFAYDYAQQDTDVLDSQSHGTHVSGSAVGNSDRHKGVAPDAQLVFMKVFGDTGASDVDIIAALEDCAVLGVDVINLSLGSGGGFTYVDHYQAALDACRELGIQVVAACGNDSDARYGLNNADGNLGLPLALVSEPDTGIAASPSTHSHALSTASVTKIQKELRTYLLCGGEKVYYNEINQDTAMQFNRALAGEYAYVAVPGAGGPEDYAGLDVTGKIAVVRRGQITFLEKEQNAFDAGAAGLILVNTEEEFPTVVLEQLLPAVMISGSDGDALEGQPEKLLTVSSDQQELVDADRGGLMATASSLGVAPDMTLKPEITAPGHGEYSAVPGGYQKQSGTSMASPQIAGASALLTQYYAGQNPQLTGTELAKRVSGVLMNTAKILTDEWGVPYSPRKQGSGLAQILSAIRTPSYVTVAGNERPVAQLGSSQSGSFRASFTVHNTGDTPQTYDLGAVNLVPKTELYNGYLCMSTVSRQLTEEEVTVRFSRDTVTVAAGGSAEVEVSLELTEAGKAGLADFCNGIYLDGYLLLDSAEGVDLHIPYIGFFGDWYALDIFDDSAYGPELPSVYGARVTCLDANGIGVNLGANAFDGSIPVSQDHIAVGQQYMNSGYLPSFWYGLLRGAKSLTFQVLDPEGNPLELYHPQTGEALGTSQVTHRVRKSYFSSGSGAVSFCFLPDTIRWLPAMETEAGLAYLPDGVYTVRATAMPDGTEDPVYAQNFDFPVRIDSQMPEVTHWEVLALGQQRYLSVKLRDDHLLMGAQLADEGGTTAYTNMLGLCAEESDYLVDVTALVEEGIGAAKLYLCDYARNYAFSETIPLDVTRVLPESVYLARDSFQCEGAQTIRLEAWMEPETVKDPELLWTSSDETVATVTGLDETRVDGQTGRVYYLADVEVKNVTGQVSISVLTESGATAAATISVTATQPEIPEPTEPAEPTEPTEPTNPAEPTEPVPPETEPEEPPTEPEATEPEKPEKPDVLNPDTGDTAKLGLYLAICLLSASAAIILGLYMRRKLR